MLQGFPVHCKVLLTLCSQQLEYYLYKLHTAEAGKCS